MIHCIWYMYLHLQFKIHQLQVNIPYMDPIWIIVEWFCSLMSWRSGPVFGLCTRVLAMA